MGTVCFLLLFVRQACWNVTYAGCAEASRSNCSACCEQMWDKFEIESAP